jgi:HSP20 family protein
MASNINIRRDDEASRKRMMPKPSREWEPWDPFRAKLMTAFDVKDTPEAFVFQADVPGLQEKDIEVQLQGNRLTIRGKRESEREQPGHTYYAYERSFGSFARSFTLPESADADKCNATLGDGVLTVTVPKKAAEQPKTIAVKKTPPSMKS